MVLTDNEFDFDHVDALHASQSQPVQNWYEDKKRDACNASLRDGIVAPIE